MPYEELSEFFETFDGSFKTQNEEVIKMDFFMRKAIYLANYDKAFGFCYNDGQEGDPLSIVKFHDNEGGHGKTKFRERLEEYMDLGIYRETGIAFDDLLKMPRARVLEIFNTVTERLEARAAEQKPPPQP